MLACDLLLDQSLIKTEEMCYDKHYLLNDKGKENKYNKSACVATSGVCLTVYVVPSKGTM